MRADRRSIAAGATRRARPLAIQSMHRRGSRADSGNEPTLTDDQRSWQTERGTQTIKEHNGGGIGTDRAGQRQGDGQRQRYQSSLCIILDGTDAVKGTSMQPAAVFGASANVYRCAGLHE
jgi:hypothetical protein